MEIEQVTFRIASLSKTLCDVEQSKRAFQINNILLLGENVPPEVLRNAWHYYSYKNGFRHKSQEELSL